MKYTLFLRVERIFVREYAKNQLFVFSKVGDSMDLRREMVIIDKKIVTSDISYCVFDTKSSTYIVKYKKNNNKFYHFSKNRLQFITNPKLLDLKDYNFYVNHTLLENIKEIYEFLYNDSFYYHVIFRDESFIDYQDDKLKKMSKHPYDVIDYMRRVSEITSLHTEDGKKLLYEKMKEVEVDNLDTALASYLKLSNDLIKENDVETLIFPFGCNLSQYEAVENAVYNKISVIEGPPGTGKTQTILNIVANIMIRNMNCQVVSNNNAAIENIDEKLKKYDLDFFEALLGKKENRDLFIKRQDGSVPEFDEYKNMNIHDISSVLRNNNLIVRKVYHAKRDLANFIKKKSELELEYRYFKELIKTQEIVPIELEKYDLKKLKLLWNEIISIDKLSIWNKMKYVLIYKIGNFKFYHSNLNVILKSLQNLIYLNDLNELDCQIKKTEEFINSHKEVEENFIESSMDYFKKYLSMKYKMERKKYSSSEIWKNCEEFLKDYPVVLSTTYSSRNTFGNDFKFDYIIMDESSQIDVVTGTLALSSAKYAVVIGDERQLPNVVPSNISKQVGKIFDEYLLDKSYSYSLNSFLASVKNTIPNIPNKMLVEHYRCHPKIINFCNQKFYNDKLVIMTKDHGEKDVIKVIRTKKGNHFRDMTSQRQVDEIKQIVANLKDNDIGVMAPYNNQVELIKENVENLEVLTVHKFQGREKNVIIISTVEDDMKSSMWDARLLNVAISRAKKQLFFIVTGNEIKNTNITDFIDYVDYHNMKIVSSKIYSSFDILYKQNELERLLFFKKHHRILKYDSENIIYYLIEKVIGDYDNLKFHFHQSLNDLIRDKSLLNSAEKKYASHHSTHIDFYILKKIGDRPVLAIEVDGYKNHKKGTKQYERDLLKNSILEKYHIPLIRLKTNGSGEEAMIREKLDVILKRKVDDEN